MGFEDYHVVLAPENHSPIRKEQTLATLEKMAATLQSQWPELRSDLTAVARLEYPKQPENVFLVYEVPAGLFEMLLTLNVRGEHSINVSLRFAYCNPRSVYDPFCTVIQWLMQRYALYCQISRDLAPEQKGVSDTIAEAKNVCSVLVPSMDYNRRLWQLDSGTDEEAALRPGEAIARFIAPHFISGI